MSEFIIKTEKLCRNFDSVCAVDRISMSLKQGQILAIIGPNGAGKTTLLKLLLGLIAPDEGHAEVLGQPCFPPRASATKRIATLLETYQPPYGARIRDLLSLKAGTGSGLDIQRATELVKQKGHKLNNTWHTLSKGQGRWVLSAIALASNPDLLIMDEPADGLDPSSRRQLYALIREEVNRWDTTALITSHILPDVERIADEVAIIDHGRLLFHASLEDLREQVREVELSLPEGLSPAELPEGTELLGQKISLQTTLAWIRHHDGKPDETTLPGELRRRPANLEQIYMALTEYRDY